MSVQIPETESSILPVVNGKEPSIRANSQAADDEKCDKHRDEKRDFYTTLRQIQAELEDLLTILTSIRRGQTIIPTYAEYIDTTRKDLCELIESINNTDIAVITEEKDEVENHLHTIRHINNAWEQMKASPLISDPRALGEDAKTSLEFQNQLHYLDLLDEQIHMFNYQISLITIPHQVKHWLKNTGPGFFLPFHEVFANDLPGSDDRDSILRYIALTPHLIRGGYVDIDSGRIYAYSTNPWRRILSLLMILAGLGIATGIVVVAGAVFIKVPISLEEGDLSKMLVGWAAVLAGMVVHVLVGSAKRAKKQNGMPSVMMDMILIIDARFGEILMKLSLGLIGLFGLLIISNSGSSAAGILNQFTPLNAFLVGYSLDSIIELFGTSMEGTSQVTSLLKPK